MIKRSFRFGLLVGLLGGLAFALLKALSGREEEPAPASSPAGREPGRATPWPRLEADPAVPAAPRLGLVPDPDAPVPPAPEPTPVTGPVAMAPAPEAPAPAHDTEVPEPAAPTSKDKATKQGKTAKAAKASKPSAKAAKAAKKASKKKAAPARAWVDPEGDVCPASHPVKAKLASKIFHVPGGLSYGRTRPDRCYRDDAAAEADGLRPAKR